MTRFTACSFLLLSLAGTLALRAQMYEIRGKVVNPAGEALPRAEVYLGASGEIQSCDREGNFGPLRLKAGPQALTIYAPSYESYRLDWTVGQDTSLRIVLRPWQQELREVEVRANRSTLGRKRLREVQGTALYAGKKSEVVVLDHTPGNAATNNARELFAQVTGLNIYEGTGGGLQLHIGGRGLDPSRTSNFNVRQNGYDISADVLGYPESYYTPPAEALQEIQVVRGAASLQYGTQFGGLLNFRFKEAPENDSLQWSSRQTAGSNGLLTSFNSLSGTVDGWSYYSYFHYKEGDGFRANSRYYSRNFFGRVAYEWAPRSKISLEYTLLNYLAQQPGGLTDQQMESDPESSPRSRNWFEVDWHLYALKWEQNLSPKTDFQLNLFGLQAQRNALGFRGVPSNLNQNPVTAPDEQDQNGDYIHPRDLIKGTFANGGAEARLLHRYQLLGRRAILLTGAKYYHAQNTSKQGPGSKGVGPDFRFREERFPDYPNQSDFRFPNRNVAFFSEQIWYLSPHWSITPGLRYEYIQTGSRGNYQRVNFDNAGNAIFRDTLEDRRELGRHLLLAGLGVSYKPKPRTEIYANFSQNYRSVTFSDIRVVNPSFKIDPQLEDERGYTADLGYRGYWGDYLEYDWTAFALLYGNRIGLIFNDRAQRVRTNIGSALIYGLESFLRYPLLREEWKWSIFSNLSLTHSQYFDSKESNVEGNRVELVPALNLKAGSSLGWKSFQTSLQWTYLSRQFTDAENSPAPPPGDLRAGILGPVPSYGVVDWSVAYRPGAFTLEAGVNNALDNSYFSRRATGYPGPGIIPAAPRTWYFTLGYQW